MKNLPEHEFFKGLESRLGNYTESPDDAAWEKISAAINHGQKPRWLPWTERLAAVIVVAAVALLFYHQQSIGHQPADATSHLALRYQHEQATVATPHDTRTDAQARGQDLVDGRVEGAPHPTASQSIARTPQPEAVVNDARGDGDNRETQDVAGAASTGDATVTDEASPVRKSKRGTDSDAASISQPQINDRKHGHQATVPQQQLADANTGADAPANAPIDYAHANMSSDRPAGNESMATGEAYGENTGGAQGEGKNETTAPGESAANTTTPAAKEETIKETIKNADVEKTETKADSKEHIFNPKRKPRKGFTAYAMLTPSLSFYSVTPLANDAVVMKQFSSPSMLSGSRIGAAFDVGLQGYISNRISYIAGLSYYSQSQALTYTYQDNTNVLVETGSDGLSYKVTPQTGEQTLNYTMHNVGVQAGLLYTLADQRLIHKIGATLHYQRGLYQGGEGDAYQNKGTNYLGYRILYRVELPINSRLTLMVQPMVEHPFWSTETLQAPFTLKTWRAGIGVGAAYRF